MSTLGEKLKHELRELIPVTVFFFGTFQLFALTQALWFGPWAASRSPSCSSTIDPARNAEREANQL